MAHRNKRMLFLCTGFAALTIAHPALAQQSLSKTEATTYSESDLQRSAVGASRSATVSAVLGANGRDLETARSISETSSHDSAQFNRTYATYEQRINGLRVHGAFVKAAFAADGRMMHMLERLAPAGGAVARPTLDDAEALRLAIDLNFVGRAATPQRDSVDGAVSTFQDNAFFHQAPTVERVIIASDEGLGEGFHVETWSEADNQLYHTVIDGLGRVVANELRTANDRYRVYPDHPGNSSQTITNGADNGNAQSPSGWLSGSQTTRQIRGNNVRAYLDTDNNGSPDSGGVSVTNGDFLAQANLSQSPSTSINKDVAVQSLFYWNNIIHDDLYRHGFTESRGNFQEDNFGKGGRGSDSVNAEGQDGGGTNNANFATPSDGSNPRMQMYIWTSANPDRDGDLDSDIIWHEYGHGLTWRMIGSMSGRVSGAIGEGMSDVLAIVKNNDDRVAEYSANRSTGLRSARYTNFPKTLGDFTGGSVHRDGEIYAATIWKLKQIFDREGLSRDLLMDHLVDGMNFTAPGPDYFDMRDGILASTPSSRDCLVWEAFAAFGMGEGGSMNSTGSSITESFTVPSSCDDGGDPPPPPPPPDPEPEPDPDPEYRLQSIAGSSSSETRNRWRATATFRVTDNGANASGVRVSYRWVRGRRTYTGSCTTNSIGVCGSNLTRISKRRYSAVTVTVTALDGDSSAGGVPRTITINRP